MKSKPMEDLSSLVSRHDDLDLHPSLAVLRPYVLVSHPASISVMALIDHINQDDVVRTYNKNGEYVFIKPPRYLVRLAQNKSPAREYWTLHEHYPWLLPTLVADLLIPLDLIEAHEPWTFENELEALDARGW